MSKKLELHELSLIKLVEHVHACEDSELTGVTCQELAKRIDYVRGDGEGFAFGMGRVLGLMQKDLLNLEAELVGPVPQIQSLVVRKQGSLKHLPGEGVKEFWPDYPQLTTVEKRHKVRREYVFVAEFGDRWNEVLSAMGLPQVHCAPEERVRRSHYARGGESAEHAALKKYVSLNPQLIPELCGVGADDLEVCVEYTFPSLDAIDVMFKTRDRWVGVEVKSSRSDQFPEDYERGVYQCVKYRALLEAMRLSGKFDVPSEVKVYLLLESNLPQEYQGTADTLGVSVIQAIVPT